MQVSRDLYMFGMERTMLVKENILWLEVAVHDSSLMTRTHTTDDLAEKASSHWFLKVITRLLHEGIEKVPTEGELHDVVHEGVVRHSLEESNHIGVCHRGQHRYLLLILSATFRTGFELLHAHDLNGKLLSVARVFGQLHLPEFAFPLGSKSAVSFGRCHIAELRVGID